MEYVQDILAGKLFIYPTDTVYGIGCDATNEVAVAKIKELKRRDKEKPLSVIAPSVEWIQEHCEVDVALDNYLPGPYTMILKKKDKNYLKHVATGDSLGIRIPTSEFTKEIQAAGRPFITTSVNISGKPHATSVEEVPEAIMKGVDVMVDAGTLTGIPSTLVKNGKEMKR